MVFGAAGRWYGRFRGPVGPWYGRLVRGGRAGHSRVCDRRLIMRRATSSAVRISVRATVTRRPRRSGDATFARERRAYVTWPEPVRGCVTFARSRHDFGALKRERAAVRLAPAHVRPRGAAEREAARPPAALFHVVPLAARRRAGAAGSQAPSGCRWQPGAERVPAARRVLRRGHRRCRWRVLEGTPELYQRFGPTRVLDTRISEPALAGAAFGPAVTGMRPVFEVTFGDFMGLAIDSLVGQSAKLWYISNEQGSVPLVVRSAVAGGGRFGAIHSQTHETWFQGVPGPKIALRSVESVARTNRLLAARRIPAPAGGQPGCSARSPSGRCTISTMPGSSRPTRRRSPYSSTLEDAYIPHGGDRRKRACVRAPASG
jgi:hypothetical protein